LDLRFSDILDWTLISPFTGSIFPEKHFNK